MARNGRLVTRSWDPAPTPEQQAVHPELVAPHRYRYDRDDHEQPEMEYDAWRAALAYHEGDIVYVDRDGTAVLARVVDVHSDRDNRHDERRAKYRVQLATKAGTWSKVWVYVWAGHIQRGYALAGLAPDVPERDRRP